LLSFKGLDFYRQLGRYCQTGNEHKLPSLHLCAIAEVEVFGQRIVFPSSGFLDGFPPKDSRRAIEVEEVARAGTRADVAAVELEARRARDTASSARAARWPALAVGARYELHAPRPAGRYGDSLAASAGVRVPLFASGAVAARVAEAGADVRAADAAARERRLVAEEEAARARAELEAADARLQAFTEQEAAARQAREIQQERYQEGAARLSDLLEARAAETGARLGAVAARGDRVLAESNLRFALGVPIQAEDKP
jgi:outer membrane protein TolC